jgi:hypothetical protein
MLLGSVIAFAMPHPTVADLKLGGGRNRRSIHHIRVRDEFTGRW